ncbi:MAG TPA: sugar ABC transporter substrate-binding protein [Chloroflexota bacterium]|nr:sugar ABC transporter substrate-binding protein [Chloroflexota bacterium]
MARIVSRRRFVLGAALASGAALLAACGQVAAPTAVPPPTATPSAAGAATKPAAGATTQPAAGATTVAAAAGAPKATGVIEITFASHGDQSEQDFYKKAVERFNQKQSAIHATFQAEPTNNWQKYLTLMAGGTMYDTFRNEEKRVAEFVERGAQLLDVTDKAQKDKIDKEDFPPTVWDEFFWKGKMYGFGHDLSPAVIFYNRKLFKDKGVPPPPTKWGDPKWDWNAFVDTAKKLTFGDGPQKVFGFVGNTWWVYMHPWIWSNGGQIVDDNGKLTIDQPETVEAFQFYADLNGIHHVMPVAADMTNGPAQLYESQRAAMYINNTSYTIRARQLKDVDWEMAPYPTGKTGKVFDRVPNNLCSAYAKTPHPDAAWEYLKHMASKEATFDARGMPSRISVARSDDFLKRTPNQNWQLLVDAGPIRRTEPRTPYFNLFDDTLRAAWESVQNGNKTVKDMIAEMKPKLTKILEGQG